MSEWQRFRHSQQMPPAQARGDCKKHESSCSQGHTGGQSGSIADNCTASNGKAAHNRCRHKMPSQPTIQIGAHAVEAAAALQRQPGQDIFLSFCFSGGVGISVGRHSLNNGCNRALYFPDILPQAGARTMNISRARCPHKQDIGTNLHCGLAVLELLLWRMPRFLLLCGPAAHAALH